MNMLYQYDKCFCERCEEPVYVPQWNMPESSHGIVSLCDMGIKTDFVSKSSKTSFDLVCVDCLTPYESDQVDAYFAREYPSKYSKEHAEALIQAASKMLQERISK